MAARWSAPLRSNPSDVAINRPSEDTATASRTPSVLRTKLASNQLNWCASDRTSTLIVRLLPLFTLEPVPQGQHPVPHPLRRVVHRPAGPRDGRQPRRGGVTGDEAGAATRRIDDSP